jgi:two-component system, LytTR family, response regulator
MIVKAIIADDESAARNVLRQLIELEHSDIEIVELCKDVPSTVEAILKHRPDVVFLDVDMPGYAGYEIVDFFEEIDFQIVFVTAYNDYAIKAFEINAIDYLLKPIHRSRLSDAILKLRKRLYEKNTTAQFHMLQKSLTDKSFEHIVISEVGRKQIVNFQDIVAIEAQGAYSILHLLDNKSIVVTKNIKQFEGMLSVSNQFFRVHKSWIIHLKHIQSYSNVHLEASLVGGIISKISKYKKSEFEAMLKI